MMRVYEREDPTYAIRRPGKIQSIHWTDSNFCSKGANPICLRDGCHIELELCDTPGNPSHFTAGASGLHSLPRS